MGARCKGARVTGPGGTEQALAPAAGQVEGTSASGWRLPIPQLQAVSRLQEFYLEPRAGTDGKLSRHPCDPFIPPGAERGGGGDTASIAGYIILFLENGIQINSLPMITQLQKRIEI